MTERLTVSVTRTLHGAWECAAIVQGCREVRTYYQYSRRDAVADFRRTMRHLLHVKRRST